MQRNKILITGGCGFLGQHLIDKLLSIYPELKIKILDLRPGRVNIFKITFVMIINILKRLRYFVRHSFLKG